MELTGETAIERLRREKSQLRAELPGMCERVSVAIAMLYEESDPAVKLKIEPIIMQITDMEWKFERIKEIKTLVKALRESV
jgi:hypothetical protein